MAVAERRPKARKTRIRGEVDVGASKPPGASVVDEFEDPERKLVVVADIQEVRREEMVG